MIETELERFWDSISPDQTLLVGNKLGGLVAWNIGGSNAPLFQIEPRDGNRSISFLGFTKDSENIIAYQPLAIEYYSSRTGKLVKTLSNVRPKSLWFFKSSPDDSLITFNNCEEAGFYRPDTGEKLFELDLVCKTATDIMSTSIRDMDVFLYHPSSKFLLTTSDKMIRFWDMKYGKLLQTLVAPDRREANRKDSNRDDGLTSDAEWIQDGRLLYVVGADRRSILLWELK